MTQELQLLARSKKAPTAGHRPGAARWDYRRLAREYLKLQEKGIGHGIRLELARQESRRQKRAISVTQIRDALTQTTRLGYLSPGTPGRAARLAGPSLFADELQEES